MWKPTRSFIWGEPFEDLGLFAYFGIGGFTLKRDDEVKADGGALSVVAAGAHYEPLRFWQISMGPSLEYARFFSTSLELAGLSAGLRFVFYGGP